MKWKIIIALIILFILIGGASTFFINFNAEPMIIGTSFSPEHAIYLKLDPHQVFTTMLDDWNFRYIRLSAQWNTLEKEKDKKDFSYLDWYMDEAAKRGAKVILAVGQKTPRWPECHIPKWAAQLPKEEYDQSVKNYIGAVVERYKNHPALEIWQVENEPYLKFFAPECPGFDNTLVQTEIDEVKKIDKNHPVLISDSGELSTWIKTAKLGDLFGTTLYRTVWNKYIGYWNYDWLPPVVYRAKLWLNGRNPAETFVSELQAEPWLPNQDLFDASIEEQQRSMDLKRLQKNIQFAHKLGLPRAYLWGAEWWYWLREQGNTEISNYITDLKKQ